MPHCLGAISGHGFRGHAAPDGGGIRSPALFGDGFRRDNNAPHSLRRRLGEAGRANRKDPGLPTSERGPSRVAGLGRLPSEVQGRDRHPCAAHEIHQRERTTPLQVMDLLEDDGEKAHP